MVKVALLVGVSEYQADLSPLPGALRDTAAMKRVLEQQGNFDQINVLENPAPLDFQEAAEIMFSGRKKDDLILIFFSGHGIKDDSGRLYFATRITRKSAKGNLVKATAVPAAFLHDIMGNSRCKRQVVILDCCFSGAFAEGMRAKDDGAVDVEAQLGGEGRAVLTSSSSTQYSFEQSQESLSVYTRFIIEGIETGAADTDSNGLISIDELHDYASAKVQEVAPAMKPKIYAVEEGFKICLAEAPTNDPKLQYRQQVEKFATRGRIAAIGRSALDSLRAQLELSRTEATAIEAEVLRPYREHQYRLEKYESALSLATKRQGPITSFTLNDLNGLQEVLGLKDQDVAPIKAKFESRTASPESPKSEPPKLQPNSQPLSKPVAAKPAPVSSSGRSLPQSSKLPWMMGGIAAGGVLLGAIALSQLLDSTADIANTPEGNLPIPPVPGAQTYTHPEGLYTVSFPTGYDPEPNNNILSFESSNTPFGGAITTDIDINNLSLSGLETKTTDDLNKLKEEFFFDKIIFLSEGVCEPRNENYACLIWEAQDGDDWYQGESIAAQVDDQIFMVHLYDTNLESEPQSQIADHIVGTFSPFNNSVRIRHTDH